MSALIKFPSRARGRPTAKASAEHEIAIEKFCAGIIEIRSTLDFQVSARGWCYILEEYGLGKDEFDDAQELMVACRKDGRLPLNIVAADEARAFDGLEQIDLEVESEAEWLLDTVEEHHKNYTPVSFWDDQEYYVQMLVEKIDLKSLFKPVCAHFHIPLANSRGWGDINGRADMMRRFDQQELEGKKCVLLYCGDHDPGGLQISESLRSNMEAISEAVG